MSAGGLAVRSVEAVALSVDLRTAANAVTLGTGTAIKKDVVVVKVRTEDGIVGYGEAHHALAPTVVADLVNQSLAPLVVGEDALAIEHIWERLYVAQGRTHGPGWAIWKTISGIDLALWDARGKALGYVRQGFTAVKLRVGDSIPNDVARVQTVREVLGSGIDIMVDVNTKYTYQQMLRLLPPLDECSVFWIEEPFLPDAIRDYTLLAKCSNALIYEADLSALNPSRDDLVHPRATIGPDGCVEPSDGPSLRIEVDESVFVRSPGIPGLCYV